MTSRESFDELPRALAAVPAEASRSVSRRILREAAGSLGLWIGAGVFLLLLALSLLYPEFSSIDATRMNVHVKFMALARALDLGARRFPASARHTLLLFRDCLGVLFLG